MSKDTKKLVFEVSIGIIIYNLVIMGLAFVFFPESSVFLGIFIGLTIAVIMIFHMGITLEKAIDTCDSNTAQKKTVINSILRNVLFIVLLVVLLWKFPQVNILAVVIGTLGLKVGAYLQPLIHKTLTHGKG